MADFCKQCSIENFGSDYGDLANLSTEKNTKNGIFPVVMCEGCGTIQVDHEGTCLSCYKQHAGWKNYGKEK